VPGEEFEQVLPELRSLGGRVKKVLAENISGQDVTEEYTDLQSQLRNLQATETRLLQLYEKAVVITVGVFLWWLLPVLLVVWVVRRTGRRGTSTVTGEPSA
jgi:hypothetical protein